ncbi:YqgE/AlgH family protein [Shewanella donghaensis]|uniref:YqgE/AlgH family protein n=1 Tax=Shewanella donghaensis TaxID=238836 RepID=UPI001182069E|nr:YqgE/AlgH family protein [Shewanella donghaensis]
MDSLQGHLLIAMPSLDDSFFERSVIYICEHNEKGAMGVMINRSTNIVIDELLEQIGLANKTELSLELEESVLLGGPVDTDRGFVLHTPQQDWVNSESVSEFCMLTTSRDVLNSLGGKDSPKQFKVALGYAGWSKDQLEDELAENTWLTIEATPELVFNQDIEQLWTEATKQLGFDIWQISSQVGHS